jgi:hypothetical protein
MNVNLWEVLGILMYNEDEKKELLAKKVDFIIKKYTGGVQEVANLFGYKKSTSISNICQFNLKRPKASRSIVQLQMEGLERHYQIPIEIFDHAVAYDEELIISMVEKYKIKVQEQKKSQSLFENNPQLIEKLQGDWYSYFYPSSNLLEVQSIKTTIQSDYTVIDEYQNRGLVHIGADQSIIIKESNNSKNITAITFNNRMITYKIFPYSMISRTNATNRSINYFGFFSREQFDTQVVKQILGEERNLMQLQIPYEFEERVAAYCCPS